MDNTNLIISDKNFKIICESEKYILGNMWNHTYLFCKQNEEVIELCDFYGDPECGVIYDAKNWCVVGGDIVAIWKDKTTFLIESDELVDPFKIRIKDKNIVEILTDPWSMKSAIWELNIENLTYKKIKDFIRYQNEPYEKNIEW